MQEQNSLGQVLTEQLEKLMKTDLAFTDIRIEPGAPIMIKMPRGWEAVEGIEAPPRELIQAFLDSVAGDWRDTLNKKALNPAILLGGYRLRANIHLAYGGQKEMISIRRIPENPPKLQETGLPPGVRIVLDEPYGILLTAGATSSGKSTSLAAMANSINEARASNIITIEDPIEFIHKPIKSIFTQREVGLDVPSFFDGVRDAMRQSPDVIIIGEIRDRETAETAILAGESGHLVLGSLHASSAAGAIQKILSFFPANERASKLASLQTSLIGVISQILLPNVTGKGRALASEFMSNNRREFSKMLDNPEQLQQLLRDHKTSQTIEDSLTELVKAKKITKMDAIRAVSGSPDLYNKLKQLEAN